MLLLTVFHGKKDTLSHLSITECKWRQQRGVQANLYNFVQLCIMQGVKYCTDRTHTVLLVRTFYISILCTVQGHLHNLCEYITQYFLYFLYEYLMQVSDTMAECHCICQSCLPPPPTPDYPNIHTNNYRDYYPNTYKHSHTTKHTHTHIIARLPKHRRIIVSLTELSPSSSNARLPKHTSTYNYKDYYPKSHTRTHNHTDCYSNTRTRTIARLPKHRQIIVSLKVSLYILWKVGKYSSSTALRKLCPESHEWKLFIKLHFLGFVTASAWNPPSCGNSQWSRKCFGSDKR